MGKINWGRVVAGGLLAGLVLNCVDFVVNGMLLAADWNAAMKALGKGEMAGSMIAWFVVYDFLLGIFTVWLYAAIRPRFGAGPKTAASAGFAVWFVVAFLHSVGDVPIGLFPLKLYLVTGIVALASLPLAAVAGAWPYKEA